MTRFFRNNFLKVQWKTTVAFILFVILLLVLSHFQNKRVHKSFIDSNFSGIITEMEFSQKGFPIIHINEKEHYLFFYHSNLDSYIQIGDSVVKKEGIGDLYVYRRIKGYYKVKTFKSW